MLADESTVQSLGHWRDTANPGAGDCEKHITWFHTSSISFGIVWWFNEDGILI
jgi:hypothetical protein